MKKLFLFLLSLRARKVLTTATSVIGITGSIGKTTTRMAIAHILSSYFRVQTSPQNFNTPIGLLLTILKKETLPESRGEWLSLLWNVFSQPLPHPEILVLEYGIDTPGDMDDLLVITTPDIAVMTPITPVHMAEGQFSSVNDIRREKLKLAHAAKKMVIGNAFDAETTEELQRLRSDSLILFGENTEYSPFTKGVLLKNIISNSDGISFTLDGEVYKAPLIGTFQAQIVAPAILIARMFGLPSETIRDSLSTFSPPSGRGRIFEGIHNSRIWDFSYNSSPAATSAVLSAFGTIGITGRKIALLGNMNELGELAFSEHVRLGETAAKYVDELVFVGKNAEAFAKGVAEKVPLRCFEDANKAGNFLQSSLKEGDFLLVKGSQNKVFLEKAIRMLLKNPNDEKHLCRNSKRWRDQST
ncbi:UDP-N-acetylmuramoyl-tripeptide--D-alanyl-D-alanine ligase [Candidatus Peregrinibacteria bacterium]|nr:MAG: UDP-N-acetylmuramoyl-tripeptide--D-alanyl-D-alanine ligase [Candidatus Peregrinibacteria bacterium]